MEWGWGKNTKELHEDDTVTDETKLNYTDDHEQVKMSFYIKTFRQNYFMLKVVKEVSASKRKAKNHATKR